jgi:hypothetical protein
MTMEKGGFASLFFYPKTKMQNFKNHTRLYPFHHFVVTPLTLIYLGWSVYKVDFEDSNSLFDVLGAVILVLLPLLARIYALKTQNRIIRMEMRQRYFQLTGRSFSEIERNLKMGQIIGLRFAGDEELFPLIEKAISENLSNKEIKQLIKNWQGDYHRV